MPHLDPYGMGASTPEEPAQDEDQPLPVPERQEEVDLARDVPESEQQPVSEDLSASGLDPGLRFQDGLGTWPKGSDITPEEVGEAEEGDQSEPEPEPYVPLIDSGGQGI